MRTSRTLGVGLLCAAVAIAVNAIMLHQIGFSGDEAYYDRMAAHPAGAHNFPYAFRVGVPFLVHLLPVSRSVAWIAVALTAAAIAAGALYALLQEFAIPPRLAASLAVGFIISPPLLVTFLRNGISVDPATLMILMLATLFIVRRNRIALAVVLMAGVTVHESCLYAMPLAYAVWARRPVDPRALRDVALVAAVPALAYIYLRSSIVAVGEQYQPGYQGSFLSARIDVIKLALRGHGWAGEIRRLALAYGPLWLFAPLALRDLPFARRGLTLVVLCAASMTFALDWGRLIFFAAPVFYVAAAWALRHRRRLAVAVVIGLLAVDAGYAVYMQVHGVRHGLDSTGPPARGPVA
ncbi:MAG TPA: hypothetical protein VFN55_01950 [Solirubrobacteraceae bacterium]|nr:hypothetical protein [Solirubrobacteraceae bacterium]